jgi:hypothetical protein
VPGSEGAEGAGRSAVGGDKNRQRDLPRARYPSTRSVHPFKLVIWPLDLIYLHISLPILTPNRSPAHLQIRVIGGIDVMCGNMHFFGRPEIDGEMAT